ncbi:MAG: LysM peptidoglycan-binding domain-containing M23 family metallopeptidase [Halanaerobiales bacterium]
MKRFIITGILIGILIIYGGYNLISGIDSRNDISNTDIGSNEVRRTDNSNKNIELNTEEFSKDNNDTSSDDRTDEMVSNTLRSEDKVEPTNTEEVIDEEEIIGPEESVGTPVKKVSLVEEILVHRVNRGENLWKIADRYDVDIDTLIGANDIANMNTIQIGDEIRILPVKGILYKINPGESLWTISRKFDITINSIVEANAILNPDLVKPGALLILPGVKPEFGYRDRLSKRFIKPVDARISSYFGPRWGREHEGIDYAVNVGTRVKAARSGKVIYSDWSAGYGYTVVIEHQKGVRTLYAHNSKLLVRGGQWVERGQVISLSGNTGRSTGPHLHFEIQINGNPVNPLNYLR